MFLKSKHRGHDIFVKRMPLRGSLWLRVMIQRKGPDVVMSVTQMRGPIPLAKSLRFSAADVMCLAFFAQPSIPTLKFDNGNGEVKVSWVEGNLVITTYRVEPRSIKLSSEESARFVEMLPEAVHLTEVIKGQIADDTLIPTRNVNE